MKAATLFSIGCLATACWFGAVSRAEACTCSAPETLVARDSSAAVFEGTVVDQRVTLASDGGFWFPVPEQDIVVRRVWKGISTDQASVLYLNRGMCSGTIPVGRTALFFLRHERGRLAYGTCMPNQFIADAAKAVARLGPPISTFSDRSAEALTVPATLPPMRRLRVAVVTGVAYYVNASLTGTFYPPLGWVQGLLLCILVLQFVWAIIFVSRRLLRRSFLLCATSAMTIVILLVWTGVDVVARFGMSELLSWR
jgi:hypothetical protein